MSVIEVVLCHPVRTPIGTYGGSLKATPATVLGAAVIRETLRRSQLSSEKIEALVMGQVVQAGSKMNPARQAGIGGGDLEAVDATLVPLGDERGAGGRQLVEAVVAVEDQDRKSVV